MTFVVVEDGASLPRDIGQADSGLRELVVLAQDGTSPADLLLRIQHSLVTLERHGRRLERAVLVVGRRSDGSAHASRDLIARDLAAHLATIEQGELQVVSPKANETDRRHELLTLAGVLTSEAPHVTVSVRFGAPEGETELPSGVYATRRFERRATRRAAE